MQLHHLFCAVSMVVLGACTDRRSLTEDEPPAAPAEEDDAETPDAIGGQTGDDNGEEIAPACIDSDFTPASLDDLVQSESVNPVDGMQAPPFPARAVLPFVLGTHRAAFEWRREGILPYGPSTNEAELTIQIELRDSEARWVHRQLSNGSGPCDDELRIGVTVSMTSSDGALQERFDAELTPHTAGSAMLLGQVSAEALQGELGRFDEYRLETLRPAMLFTRYGFQGWLDMDLIGPSGATGTTAYFPLWGSCEGTPILHDDEHPSLEDMVLTVEGGNPLMRDGARQPPISVRVIPVPRTGCYEDSFFAPRWQLDAELEFEGAGLPRLQVRLTGAQPYLPPPEDPSLYYDNPFRITVGVRGPCGATVTRQYTPAEFLENCGDWGFDTSMHAGVFIELLEASFASGIGSFDIRLMASLSQEIGRILLQSASIYE